jgi:hypothetical protein
MSAIATMKKAVSCGCGAVYERTEEKLTFRDIDTFEWRCCGTTLESWSRSRIPLFRLVQGARHQARVIRRSWRTNAGAASPWQSLLLRDLPVLLSLAAMRPRPVVN